MKRQLTNGSSVEINDGDTIRFVVEPVKGRGFEFKVLFNGNGTATFFDAAMATVPIKNWRSLTFIVVRDRKAQYEADLRIAQAAFIKNPSASNFQKTVEAMTRYQDEVKNQGD